VEDFTIPVAGSSVLGVNDFDSDDVMTVFQTSNGQINVRIKYFGKVDIQVIDITGRKFSTLKRKIQQSKSIDLSRLKAGLYFENQWIL
jgi:hypothetical protein